MARKLLLPLAAIAAFAYLAARLAPPPAPEGGAKAPFAHLRDAFKPDPKKLKETSDAMRRNALEGGQKK